MEKNDAKQDSRAWDRDLFYRKGLLNTQIETYLLTSQGMENTMLIQITNLKAIKLLYELEELHLIKVMEENIAPTTSMLSVKYRGALSKENAEKLRSFVQQSRNEWEDRFPMK